MSKNKKLVFEEVLKQNERRIHYHINRLKVRDTHQEFYQEGLFAMWNAYESYQPDKGPLSTYFNFIIRNRMIDLLRKKTRQQKGDEAYYRERELVHEDGNKYRTGTVFYPVPKLPGLSARDAVNWDEIKSQLTENQWKWVQYFIIRDMSLKEVAEHEGVSADAVKSWGREVRRKLRINNLEKL